MAKLSPKWAAGSKGNATDWRILRHKKRRMAREQPPYWHKRGDNTGAWRCCCHSAIGTAEVEEVAAGKGNTTTQRKSTKEESRKGKN